jgi:hypothetical protein
LAKLPLEEKAAPNKLNKSQQQHKQHPVAPPPKVHRTSNSFSKLFPSLKAALTPASSWANESSTTIETTYLNSSFNTSFTTTTDTVVSPDDVDKDEIIKVPVVPQYHVRHGKQTEYTKRDPEPKQMIRNLITELDTYIQRYTQEKDTAEDRVVSLHEMAWARYDSGSETGAVLSMRHAHKYMVRTNQLDITLQQLHYIRQEVLLLLEQQQQQRQQMMYASATSQRTTLLTVREDIQEKRRAMEVVLSKLRRAKLLSASIVERPTDAELLQQLYDIMEVEEV